MAELINHPPSSHHQQQPNSNNNNNSNNVNSVPAPALYQPLQHHPNNNISNVNLAQPLNNPPSSHQQQSNNNSNNVNSVPAPLLNQHQSINNNNNIANVAEPINHLPSSYQLQQQQPNNIDSNNSSLVPAPAPYQPLQIRLQPSAPPQDANNLNIFSSLIAPPLAQMGPHPQQQQPAPFDQQQGNRANGIYNLRQNPTQRNLPNSATFFHQRKGKK